jgi:hypothetical protein
MAKDDPLATLNDAQDAYDKAVSATHVVTAQPWSETLVIYLSMSILAFLIITFALATALLWRRNAEAPEVLKIFGILSIVGLSALLLITGFSNDQLTPIVGLFGAIAGYLLGKDSKRRDA